MYSVKILQLAYIHRLARTETKRHRETRNIGSDIRKTSAENPRNNSAERSQRTNFQVVLYLAYLHTQIYTA